MDFCLPAHKVRNDLRGKTYVSINLLASTFLFLYIFIWINIKLLPAQSLAFREILIPFHIFVDIRIIKSSKLYILFLKTVSAAGKQERFYRIFLVLFIIVYSVSKSTLGDLGWGNLDSFRLFSQ